MYELLFEALCVLVLISASVSDLKTREVSDIHWIALGAMAIVSSLTIYESTSMTVLYALTLTYMFTGRTLVLLIQLVITTVTLAYGDACASIPSIMCILIVALYHIDLLKGGADAKALMCIAMLFPTSGPGVVGYIANPSMGVIVVALFLSLTGCLWVMWKNISNHDFHPRMFTSYRMPSDEIDDAFVWEVDRNDNISLVTPMIPFMVPMTVALCIVLWIENPILALL